MANVGKLLVEHFDVLARSVFAHMSVGFNEVKLDLQRSVGEESQQVGFGHDFEGHKIKDCNFKRTNVLR